MGKETNWQKRISESSNMRFAVVLTKQGGACQNTAILFLSGKISDIAISWGR